MNTKKHLKSLGLWTKAWVILCFQWDPGMRISTAGGRQVCNGENFLNWKKDWDCGRLTWNLGSLWSISREELRPEVHPDLLEETDWSSFQDKGLCLILFCPTSSPERVKGIRSLGPMSEEGRWAQEVVALKQMCPLVKALQESVWGRPTVTWQGPTGKCCLGGRDSRAH